MSWREGVPNSFLFHYKSFEIVGDELRGVEHHPALDVPVLLLVDVLNGAQNLLLPKLAQALVGFQNNVVL